MSIINSQNLKQPRFRVIHLVAGILALGLTLLWWNPQSVQAADINYDDFSNISGPAGSGGGGGAGGGGGGGGGGQGGGGGGGAYEDSDGNGEYGGGGGKGGGGGGGGAGGSDTNGGVYNAPTAGTAGEPASGTGSNSGGDDPFTGTGGTKGNKPSQPTQDGIAGGDSLDGDDGSTTTSLQGAAGGAGSAGGTGGAGGTGITGADGIGYGYGTGSAGGTGGSGGLGGSGAGDGGLATGSVNSNGNNGSQGANAGSSGIGGTGILGGIATQESTNTETVTAADFYDRVTIRSYNGGNGGLGGFGGNAGAPGLSGGAGHDGDDDGIFPYTTYTGGEGKDGGQGALGGQGGIGGAGGQGYSSESKIITVDASQPTVTIGGPTILFVGNAGSGGKGGDTGNDHTGILGGNGGAGGAGGNTGPVQLTFQSDLVIFRDTITVTAGSGGNSGLSGSKIGGTFTGAGGSGGTGGSASLIFEHDVILNNSGLTLISGNGAEKLSQANADTAAAAAVTAGVGGDAEFWIKGNLLAETDTVLTLTRGTKPAVLNSSDNGTVTFKVDEIFEVKEGRLVKLNISGPVSSAEDVVSITTLLLGQGSTFQTQSAVYTVTPGAAPFYQVENLDVLTDATWDTDGTFAPDSSLDHFIRLDLSNIDPEHLVLTFNGSNGKVDLANFDPKGQHDQYLTTLRDNDLHRYYDTPAYRDAAWPNPSFFKSVYQTKKLDLGTLTLIDQTAGTVINSATYTGSDNNQHFVSSNSALSDTEGDLYDDFAFTAGLRRYYWDVYVDSSIPGNPLKADNYYTADASKVYSQSAGAAIISANQTQEVTLNAFDKTVNITPTDRVSIGGYFGGSHTRTETGSHVDVNNITAALLIAKKSGYGFGNLTLGAFGEFSRGNYDTFSYIPGYGEIFGDGDVESYGGGVFVKSEFKQNSFIEASVRGGGINNEFSVVKDHWIRRPEVHSYETTNSYYGAHVGIGHKFTLGAQTSLDGYGRYFWTRTQSDNFTTKFGDTIEIDHIDSSRARVGARLNHSLIDDKVNLYLGAAAEREFDGKIQGTLNRDRISHTTELEGTSGFGELGLSVRPTNSGNLTLNAEVFGWTGRQEGLGGSASLSINF
jgi:hypothetical protein